MNIWTPDLSKWKDANGKCKKLHSVMLYIYGGKSSAYKMVPFENENQQSGLTVSGELFAALHETILITFSYRHDLFSTLYLEGKLGANLGLFDQNLAIRWAKKHIGELCGDAEHLTVFAHSSAAVGLGMHLISSYSKNLISNAIMQSDSPFFRDSIPVTRDEIAINSLLAIIDLGNCTNFTGIQSSQMKELSKRVKAIYFDRQIFGYSLKTQVLVNELTKIHHVFYTSKLRPKPIDRDLLRLISFLSKRIDVACLQRLPTDQIINVNVAYLEQLWSYYVDFDFVDADAYQDYKLFNKLDLNPNLNLLIGNLVVEQHADVLSLRQDHYSDQFNAPVIEKAEMVEMFPTKSNFLASGKFLNSLIIILNIIFILNYSSGL